MRGLALPGHVQIAVEPVQVVSPLSREIVSPGIAPRSEVRSAQARHVLAVLCSAPSSMRSARPAARHASHPAAEISIRDTATLPKCRASCLKHGAT